MFCKEKDIVYGPLDYVITAQQTYGWTDRQGSAAAKKYL